jgi:hypothetical protein
MAGDRYLLHSGYYYRVVAGMCIWLTIPARSSPAPGPRGVDGIPEGLFSTFGDGKTAVEPFRAVQVRPRRADTASLLTLCRRDPSEVSTHLAGLDPARGAKVKFNSS